MAEPSAKGAGRGPIGVGVAAAESRWTALAGPPWGSTHRPLGVPHPQGQHPRRRRRHESPLAEALSPELVYKDLKDQEGVVLFMYLDTAKPPKVTVGVGNMLPNVAAAQALPFINVATKARATPDEIERTFKKVAAMEGSHPAATYKQHPSIEITEETAKTLALARLNAEFLPLLRRHFAGFDEYPLPARRALIDMIYNMGWSSGEERHGKRPRHGLITFGTLHRAAEAGDWKTAALHCHRRDTNPNSRRPSHAALRNEWTKRLFEHADQLASGDR